LRHRIESRNREATNGGHDEKNILRRKVPLGACDFAIWERIRDEPG
jgi:hypothetical protein